MIETSDLVKAKGPKNHYKNFFFLIKAELNRMLPKSLFCLEIHFNNLIFPTCYMVVNVYLVVH